MTPARRIAVRFAIFVAVIALGAWPSERIAAAFSRAYSPLANLILQGHIFGERGHVRVVPLAEIKRHDGDNVTADTALALSVDGFQGTMPLGISLRRDVYLPLLIALALIACSTLSLRRRLLCAGIAAAVTLAAGVAANALVVAWTLATQLRGVYAHDDLQRRLLDLGYGALLTPPGNRFIAPIALGVLLVAWQTLRGSRGDAPRPQVTAAATQ